MDKAAIVVLADTETHGELGRCVNARALLGLLPRQPDAALDQLRQGFLDSLGDVEH